MECRLCLCSAPAGSFVSIHDDPHPLRLVQRIWTCCQLRVRKGDHLPDMICLSCVNNLELLDSFRNACIQNDTTSRLELDKYLKVKPEEVMLEDLIWEDELGADCPPDISSSPVDGETPGRKNTSRDNVAAIIDTNTHILVEELTFRNALDKMCSTISELDHKINSVTQKNSDTRRKLHYCDICSKSFNRKAKLSEHMSVHTGVKPLKCDICSKSFNIKYKLSEHMSVHSGVKPYKCDVCFKSFPSKYRLSVHMDIHTGVRPHKCDICLKSFHRKFTLNSHMGVHTGLKPHKCELCSKTFTTKHNLSEHMGVHTGVKPHKCDTCSKSFLRKSDLNSHLRIHAGVKSHKCDICSKSFITKSVLNSHLGIHNGVKSQKCDLCSKSFLRKSDLNSHLSIHTGVKSHKCDICSKSYRRKPDLNSHMHLERFLGDPESNRYHIQNSLKFKDAKKSLKWRNIEMIEMKKFMGKVKKDNTDEYWNTDPGCATPIFVQVMSRDRFRQIWQLWHFSNNETLSDENQKLHKQLSLDESIIPWRGRLSFRVYNGAKIIKYAWDKNLWHLTTKQRIAQISENYKFENWRNIISSKNGYFVTTKFSETEKTNWKTALKVKKSSSIIDYNKFMKGVDRADQYISYYSINSKVDKEGCDVYVKLIKYKKFMYLVGRHWALNTIQNIEEEAGPSKSTLRPTSKPDHPLRISSDLRKHNLQQIDSSSKSK
ncbi:uncharacterized protein LOC143920107 [Arctopsyche grandis]|uniref:uncharacterized protein LOC143920107 n=1 Tax=Arctopsyche grandis TaxID=121162 RepID=UPI00406D67E0